MGVYSHGVKSYLASDGGDSSIKIWSLDDHTLVKSIDVDDEEICSLVVVIIDGHHALASGDSDGTIQVWNVDNYDCIATINAHSDIIWSLHAVECGGKVCLVSGSKDKTIKIWDLDNQSVLTTLNNDSYINAVAVFMNGDRACVASGDVVGNVKLWME